ncbi:MAG: hypothetical protein PHT44_00090 [Candidatus Portnoybacteria bacterium]|nr:hypothetical protein [Candidatus Portnoybacteria bacterium]MDD4982980.1 hypothetical protein [Candidatus Portnoybacteria bacterium]
MANQTGDNPDLLKEPLVKRDVLDFDLKRKKIINALGGLDKELGKQLAGVYEGMIFAFENKNNPERIVHVSHSARELSAILPRYFPGMPVFEREFLTLGKLREEIIGLKKKLNSCNPDQEDCLAMVRTNLDKLIEISSADNISQREQLKAVLGQSPNRKDSPGYLQEAVANEWVRVHRFFQKLTKHDSLKNKEVCNISEQDFESNVFQLEDILYRVLVDIPFFEPIGEIDKLLSIVNPDEQNVRDLCKLISQYEHRKYFFDKCSNPKWLGPLNRNGAFSTPQEPIKQDGYIRFFIWPESKYLARVSAEAPQEVYEIIKNLTSENQTVLCDFIDAALTSPVSIAAQYVPLIQTKNWLNNSYNLLLPDKAADLMEKLAEGGEADSAIKLAEILFDIRAQEPFGGQNDSEYRFLRHPDAKPLFDEWRFGEIMKNKTKKLSQAKPVELFSIYASKMRKTIEIEEKDRKEENNFYDLSHIWRPNLSKARHNREDAKNILIDGMIDLIEQYSENTKILGSFAEVLNKHPYGVFKRIELFLYDLRPEDFTKQIEDILVNKKTIVSYNLRREYLPLLGKAFEQLSETGKASIIKIIGEGPDTNKTDDMTQERYDAMCERWKAMYFEPIKYYLAGEAKERQEKIQKEQGGIIDDDGEIYEWEGDESPKTSEELDSMKPEEIFALLRDYRQPDNPFDRFSSTGLARNFSVIVAKDPEKIVSVSNLFVEYKIRPVYIYNFFVGIKNAFNENKKIDWKPILDLCLKVVVDDEYKKLILPGNDEQDWQSVSRAIIDLLGAGFGNKEAQLPLEFKETIWKLIQIFTEDKEPTPEDEKRDSESGLDATTFSINTVRGEAMHALINYGLWLARNDESLKKQEIKMSPEMEEILNRHLDVSVDPSLAIRSVYGWRLPNLFYLNHEWVESKKDKIFPREDELKSFWMAAWQGYLSNQVIKEIFALLKEEYKRSISLLGMEKGRGYHSLDIDEILPQHLMVAFVNGNEHDDLVDYFFENAPAKARGNAINFIGRVVFKELRDKADVNAKILKLWDKRLSLEKEKVEADEFREFGWWFKRSPFEKKETVDRFIKALELYGGKVDLHYEIAEEIQNYVKEFPVESIKIINLVVHALKEDHEIHYKKEEYRQIIINAKSTGNKEAISRADDLINYLGSRGLLDFGDLLSLKT